MARFDSVQFDDIRKRELQVIKEAFERIDHLVDTHLKSSREKAIAYTKLEEAFMWINKALKQDQLELEEHQLPIPVR